MFKKSLMKFAQQSFCIAMLIFMPVMAFAKSSHSVFPKPIQRYQRRLTACIQYAVDDSWSLKIPAYKAKKHSKRSLHHVVDGYRCWRLQRDFAALKKQYDKDAQNKGALDAMNSLIYATWGETW